MGKRFLVFLFILIIALLMLINHRRILGYFYPVQYVKYVEKYSSVNDLDGKLIYALIRTESKFNHQAVSHKGALGLMQITPQTGSYVSKLLGEGEFDSNSLLDPEVNIKYGCFYLSKLYKDFNGNLNYVLAAYNGGEGNVRKWIRELKGENGELSINDIPFAETREYVKRVERSYRMYRYLYNID